MIYVNSVLLYWRRCLVALYWLWADLLMYLSVNYNLQVEPLFYSGSRDKTKGWYMFVKNNNRRHFIKHWRMNCTSILYSPLLKTFPGLVTKLMTNTNGLANKCPSGPLGNKWMTRTNNKTHGKSMSTKCEYYRRT